MIFSFYFFDIFVHFSTVVMLQLVVSHKTSFIVFAADMLKWKKALRIRLSALGNNNSSCLTV